MAFVKKFMDLNFVACTFYVIMIIRSVCCTDNFVMLSTSDVGLLEMKVLYRGRCMLISSNPQSPPDSRLALVQITNGVRLVEMALRDGRVEDCLVTSSAKITRKFVKEFCLPKLDLDLDQDLVQRHKERFSQRKRKRRPSRSDNRRKLDIDHVNTLESIADVYSGRKNMSSYMPSLFLSSSKNNNIMSNSRQKSLEMRGSSRGRSGSSRRQGQPPLRSSLSFPSLSSSSYSLSQSSSTLSSSRVGPWSLSHSSLPPASTQSKNPHFLYHALESLRDLHKIDPSLRQYLRIGKQINLCRTFYTTVTEELNVHEPDINLSPNSSKFLYLQLDPFQQPSEKALKHQMRHKENKNRNKDCCSSSEEGHYHQHQRSKCRPCSKQNSESNTIGASFSMGKSHPNRSRDVKLDLDLDLPPTVSVRDMRLENVARPNQTEAKIGALQKGSDAGKKRSLETDTQIAHSRHKRDLLSGFMIFPGTKW